jgi:hypothetical protein
MVDPKELTSAQHLKALIDQINEGHSRRSAFLTAEAAALGEAKAFTEGQQELLNINLNLEQAALQVEQQRVAKSAEALYNLNSQITAMTLLQSKQKNTEWIDGKRLEDLKAQAAQLQKQVTLEMEKLRLSRQQQQANANLASAQQNFFKTTLGVSDAWKTTLTGAMFQSEGALRKMWTNTKGMLTASNMLGSTWMKIVEMTIVAAKEYDTMAAKIRQISHGGGGLNSLQQQTNRAHISMREFGVSIQDAGQSTEALLRSMASFSVSSAQTREALMRQTNLLQEVGVSAQGAAQAFNFMDKGLNMTNQQSIRLSNRLFGLAKALKQPPDVIFKDWEQASNELAKYGDRMYEVFAGLSAQAKNTGLAVSQLIGIAAQFDTFDQAGQAVGRLNAILGGPYLSAIEMVYATEAERITALRESISVSGRVFTQLSRHEQQAIAAAAGIRDMAQAAQLFGGSAQAFDQARASQEALEKKARESQSALNKLKMAAYGLAVNVAPLVEKFVGLLDVLTKIASSPVGKFLGILIGTIVMINKAAGAYKGTVLALSNAKKAHAFVSELLIRLTRREASLQTELSFSYGKTTIAERISAASKGTLNAVSQGLAATNFTLATSIGMVAGALAGAAAGFYLITAAQKAFGKVATVTIGLLATTAAAYAAVQMAKTAWNPAGLAMAGLALGLFAGSMAVAFGKAKVAHHKLGTDPGGTEEAGMAVIAEGKKEGVLVGLPRGATVLNNENTERVIAANQHERDDRAELEGEMGSLRTQPRPAALTAEIKESLAPVVSALQAIADNGGAGTGFAGPGPAPAPPRTVVDVRLDQDNARLFILDTVNEALG